MNEVMKRKAKDANDAKQDQEWAAYYNAPITTNTIGEDAAAAGKRPKSQTRKEKAEAKKKAAKAKAKADAAKAKAEKE